MADPVGAGVVVRGGAGGTAATLEHLRHAARVLGSAADLLHGAAAGATWAQRDGLGPVPPPPVARWPVTSSPVTHARALAELAPAVHGAASLGAQGAAVRALGAALARAADALDRAEDAAGTAVRLLLGTAGYAAGDRPLATLVAGAALARAAVPALVGAGLGLVATGRGAQAARSLVATDPAELGVQALAGALHGLAPWTARARPRPAVGASRLATAATDAAGVVVPRLGRRPLRVTARLGTGRAGAVAPRGAADVLARIGGLYPQAGGVPATVAVDRLDRPDGTRAWVVAIPGTQAGTSWGASANPMDMATNVRLMAELTDDGSELVTRALQGAGARPGEPVLLAGHSQGGMVAMALAGSAAFTARYRVAAVLTAGSPVATRTAPRSTAVLHLEHRQDLVPALDGWRNPDEPHRATAVRDLATSPVPADRLAARSPGAAHGVGTYARTARAVAALGHPSVRAWERAAASVLGPPGTTVTPAAFTGERAPVAARGRGPARDAPPVPGPAGVTLSASGSPR